MISISALFIIIDTDLSVDGRFILPGIHWNIFGKANVGWKGAISYPVGGNVFYFGKTLSVENTFPVFADVFIGKANTHDYFLIK